MGNYYFTAASLPPLQLGEKPELSFKELLQRLETNLSSKDFEKVTALRRLTDLENIRQVYLDLPIDTRANLNEKELDEALLIQDILPQYVFEFLDQFEEKKEKLRHFFGLIARYFLEEMPKQDGFLKRYLSFERDLRLVLLGLRSKRMQCDLTFQLQFEEWSDPIVALILAQKDTADFEPPQEFDDIKEKLRSCGDDPWQQFQTVTHYRFEKLEELGGYYLFSIDWILSYVVRLILAEKWVELDEERGKTLIQKFKTG